MSERIQTINAEIKKQLGEILSRDLGIKSGVFITISKVETSSDLKNSSVFVSVFPENESDYAIKTLEKEVGRLQKSLNKKLYLRVYPKIKFILDESEIYADEIDKILTQLDEERKENK